MGKLTDIQIRNWIRAGKPIARSDGGGLTFTLSRGGTAAWVMRYRIGGPQKEITLGRYPDMGLSAARQLAEAYRVEVGRGVDVAREKRKAKITRAGDQSFAELARDYMGKKFPALAHSTTTQRSRHINTLILPKLGSVPAKEVGAADVVQLLETVGKKSVNVAELVLTAFSEIFRHGIAKCVLTHNPCTDISVTAICGRPETTRQRLKLSADELHAVLIALPSIGPENALAAKILLHTCTRIGELVRAKWGHLDFERAEWTIPAENSKTKKPFVIPLTPAVLEWFQQLRPLAGDSAYVLPARRSGRSRFGDTHMEQRAINAQLHKLCDRLGDTVRRFTPHDLRSTARSHLSALGVSVIVAERCLNHEIGGLVGVYDQHDYLTERRAALSVWDEFLAACERGQPWAAGKVIPMQRTA